MRLENKNKITIKAEINTKNFLSKFGKQKGSVINKDNFYKVRFNFNN